MDNLEIDIYLKRYYKLLKDSEYFEAHEVLEELWHKLRKTKSPSTNYCKGLINGAIALEHLKRDKPKSKRVAQIAYNSYLTRSIGDNPFGVDNENIIKDIKQIIENRWNKLYFK